MENTYLGDGVSVAFDGFYIVLAAEDGFQPKKVIHLAPRVQVELVRFIERLVEKGR